jgi:hypothetical protein
MLNIVMSNRKLTITRQGETLWNILKSVIVEGALMVVSLVVEKNKVLNIDLFFKIRDTAVQ